MNKPTIVSSTPSPLTQNHLRVGPSMKKTPQPGLARVKMPATTLVPKTMVSDNLRKGFIRPVLASNDAKPSRHNLRTRVESYKRTPDEHSNPGYFQPSTSPSHSYFNEKSSPIRFSQTQKFNFDASKKRIFSPQDQTRSPLLHHHPPAPHEHKPAPQRKKLGKEAKTVRGTATQKLRMTTKVSYFDQPMQVKAKKKVPTLAMDKIPGSPFDQQQQSLRAARQGFNTARSADKKGNRSGSFVSSRSFNSQYQQQFLDQRKGKQHSPTKPPIKHTGMLSLKQFDHDSDTSNRNDTVIVSMNPSRQGHQQNQHQAQFSPRGSTRPQITLFSNQDSQEPNFKTEFSRQGTLMDGGPSHDLRPASPLSQKQNQQQIPLTAKFGRSPREQYAPVNLRLQTHEPLSSEAHITFRGHAGTEMRKPQKLGQQQDSPARRTAGKKPTVTTLKLSTVKTGKTQKGSQLGEKVKKGLPTKKKGLPPHKKKELGGPSQKVSLTRAVGPKAQRFEKPNQLDQQKRLRLKLQKMSQQLFESNNFAFRSLNVDDRTKEQIQKLMQHQVESTVARHMAHMDRLNKDYENKIVNLMEKQNNQFKHIMKLNKHRSDSHVRDLKREIHRLQTELHEYDRTSGGTGSYISNAQGAQPITHDSSAQSIDKSHIDRAREMILEVDKRHELERSLGNRGPDLNGSDGMIFDPPRENFEGRQDFQQFPANKLLPAPSFEVNSMFHDSQNLAKVAQYQISGDTNDIFQITTNEKYGESRQTGKDRMSHTQKVGNLTNSSLDRSGKSMKGYLNFTNNQQQFTPQAPSNHQLTPVNQDSGMGQRRSYISGGGPYSHNNTQRLAHTQGGLPTSMFYGAQSLNQTQQTKGQVNNRNISEQNMDLEQDLSRANSNLATPVRNFNPNPEVAECDVPDEDTARNHQSNAGTLNQSLIANSLAHTNYMGRINPPDNMRQLEKPPVARKGEAEVRYYGMNSQQSARESEGREIIDLQICYQKGNQPRESQTGGIHAIQTQAVKQMLMAKDKQEMFNLPGRTSEAVTDQHQNANWSPRSHLYAEERLDSEMGAQPVSLQSNTRRSHLPEADLRSARGKSRPSPKDLIDSNREEQRDRKLTQIVPLSPPLSSRARNKSPAILPPDSNDEERKSFKLADENDSHSNFEDTIRQDIKQPSNFRKNYEQLKREIQGSPEDLLETERVPMSKPSNAYFLKAREQLNQYEQAQSPPRTGSMARMGMPLGGPSRGISPSAYSELIECKCKLNLSLKNPPTPLNPPQTSHKPRPQSKLDDEEVSFIQTSKKMKRRESDSLAAVSEEDYNLSQTRSIGENLGIDNPEVAAFCSHHGISAIGQDGVNPICGKFCKNLTPDMERLMVLDSLKSLVAQNKMAAEYFSGTSSSQVSMEDIQKIIRSNSMALLCAQKNHKRYLIHADWWRQWCDYSNFDLQQLHNLFDNDHRTSHVSSIRPGGFHEESHQQSWAIEVPPSSQQKRELDFFQELQDLKRQNKLRKDEILRGGVGSPKNEGYMMGRKTPYSNSGEIKNKNYDSNERFMDSDRRKSKREMPIHFYQRPARIANSSLVKDPSSVPMSLNQMSNVYFQLRENLMEHFDYEAVPLEVWRLLKSWYTCDVALLRFVKKDEVMSQLFLDLYPEQKHRK